MAEQCRIEADSISPDGVRLTTFVVTFWRAILAEVNTHRMLSRNSASSRAIPVEKRIAAVESDPFVPESFGRNQKGMQAREHLDEVAANDARCTWLAAKDAAVYHAKSLANLGVHKQLANRLLEPFSWHTAVISGTDWNNFFAQRCHEDAQPEFCKVAEMMQGAMAASQPDWVKPGGWHLPFVREEDLYESTEQPGGVDGAYSWLKRLSVARCARVSYESHEGRRDPAKDLELFERLVSARPMHASPLEHVATPDAQYPRKLAERDALVAANGGVHERWMDRVLYNANFRGWHQFRHEIAGESVPG